jgi:hypothetical protein
MSDKPTWVFVAGTYRTASTTQYQMTRDIVEQSRNGIGIGYHQEKKLAEHDKPGNRYVVCKVFEFLPSGFRGRRSLGESFLRAKRMKAVITMRDPRDIIVSMRTRASNLGKKVVMERSTNDDVWSFRQTAEVNFPIWLGWLEKWSDLGPSITLVTHYESMIQNLYREVQRISSHLDIQLEPDHAKTIAKAYTKPSMKKKKVEAKKKGEKEDPWLPSVPGVVYGTSGIHKQHLTEEERKIVEDANNSFMEKFGYL